MKHANQTSVHGLDATDAIISRHGNKEMRRPLQ